MSEPGRDVGLILRAAIDAASPARAVTAAVRGAVQLPAARRIHLLALGKAADTMARAARDALPHAPDAALVVVPHDSPSHEDSRGPPAPATAESGAEEQMRVLHAAHPIPDASSARAAAAIESFLTDAREGDVVLVLLSGGASSLCAAPVGSITIAEYARVVRALMHAGADIRELNTVRACIDRLKGGGMGLRIAPARAVGLIISDVIGNSVDVIASGPLTPSAAAPADAVRVLEKYDLWSGMPESVHRALRSDPGTGDAAPAPASRSSTAARSGAAGGTAFDHVTVHVILDNSAAVAGAAQEARRLGYDVRVRREAVTGSARDAGVRIARDARTAAAALQPADLPVCLVYGGETTVTVKGSGTGGRNQELVLAAALELAGETRITVASIGTDGIDGPTDAAGAVADGRTVAEARRAGLDAADAIENNDSHSFFDAAGGLIRIGPTGTNVMDVQIALIAPPARGA